MNPLEIALIIIGIITIIISCIMVDKAQKASVQPVERAYTIEKSLSEEDSKKLKDKMEELFSEISEEVIVRTDDTLSNLSNEKIMAVNEFSDQILEKIKRNHEEVVFLYNMLNDKEKELKLAVKEIDISKKMVRDLLESKLSMNKSLEGKEPKSQATAKPVLKNQVQKDKPVKAIEPRMDLQLENPIMNNSNTNNNTQILALYAQGKSIMEISKLLNLGQGEVKLVIDLFKSKK